MEVSMMKIRRHEIKSLKLPTKKYESSWINSTDTVSLPLDSFSDFSLTGMALRSISTGFMSNLLVSK